MAVSRRHALQQGPVVAALVRTAAQAVRSRPQALPETPGPELTAVVPPRPARLVKDYIRHVGGDPRVYRGILPPHLYPQWGFPLLARTLDALPYDLTKVLNGGSRMQRNAPLPVDQPLHLRARLESIDDDGRRAVIAQRLVTGTAEVPDALICWTYAILIHPRPSGDGAPRTRRERPRVELDLREVDRWRLRRNAGLDFALLTGDFNPVHWVRPYARAAGFRSTILHGFSTLARAIESMNRNVRSGGTDWWRELEVRFVRPLVLPAKPRVYHAAGRFAVGEAPGGPAYLTGTYTEEHDG